MNRLLLLAAAAAALSWTPVRASGDEGDKKPADTHVTGHVENSSTLEHLPYIAVTVKGTSMGTSTDATGHYSLHNIPEGEHILVASSPGYASREIRVELESGKTSVVNFLLDEEIVDMAQVVVTSSRNETSKKGSSSVVNVTSSRVFDAVNSASLSDAMNFQPGLRVEFTCGNCGVPQLRINGLEGQYSQILLDGQPIFSSLAAVYGLEQIPVSMVERVEVIRGGGSALFGANAIGGVVNIITKDPLYNTLSLANTTALFGGGGADINTSLNGAFVSADNRTGAYIFGMVRKRDAYDRNGDGFSDIPALKGQTIGVRGYYRTTLRSRLTYEYHHMHEFRRGGDDLDRPPHEALIAEQLEHNIDGGGIRCDFWTPGYRHRFGVYSSAQGIARKSYFGTGRDPQAYGRTKDLVANAGLQYTWAMERLLFMPSELTAGVEYSHNALNDTYSDQREISQRTNLYGGYLQNEWKNERWGILAGARVDKHSMMERPVVSPRANLRYAPADAISLRLSYSSGYRAPQTYDEDLHVTAVSEGMSIIRNMEGLKPEYSHSVSASADLYHNFGRLQANFLVEGFYTDLRNAFDLVNAGRDETTGNFHLERRNSAGAVVRGLNFELRAGIPRVFDFQAGFTVQSSLHKEPFTWAEDSSLEPQRRMFRSPGRYGYFTSNFEVTRRFTASLSASYTGPMLVQHTLPGDGGADLFREETTRDFFDMGVRLAYRFTLSQGVGLEASAGVRNVFDSFQHDIDRGESKDAGYIYGPAMPRMYYFGLRFTL